MSFRARSFVHGVERPFIVRYWCSQADAAAALLRLTPCLTEYANQRYSLSPSQAETCHSRIGLRPLNFKNERPRHGRHFQTLLSFVDWIIRDTLILLVCMNFHFQTPFARHFFVFSSTSEHICARLSCEWGKCDAQTQTRGRSSRFFSCRNFIHAVQILASVCFDFFLWLLLFGMPFSFALAVERYQLIQKPIITIHLLFTRCLSVPLVRWSACVL